MNPAAIDLAQVFGTYGCFIVQPGLGAEDEFHGLGVLASGSTLRITDLPTRPVTIFGPSAEVARQLRISVDTEPPGGILHSGRKRRIWSRGVARYRPLLPHVSFMGPQLEPLWTNARGRAVLAWYHQDGDRILLVGLDVAEEIIRTTQGDPRQVQDSEHKARFGFDFERANYLFDGQVIPGSESEPWADRLGFAIVRLLAKQLRAPLAAPLPYNARGAVVLTGDDDQACLERYAEQVSLIGDFPITYFLLPCTKHTAETIRLAPPSVEWGLHVDALEHPHDYDRICETQAAEVRALTHCDVRTIRNHGYLSSGYLGHLAAWEHCDIALDTNYAGVSGTALNGSFLPHSVRRPDASWSSHASLLTAFGDGMIFALGWSEAQASKRIRQVAARIDRTDPGVLVFNMHPQNIENTRGIHRTILGIGRRPGWMALGMESYLDWLLAWRRIRMTRRGADWGVDAPDSLSGLTMLWPEHERWTMRVTG